MSEIKLTIDGTEYELDAVDWLPSTVPFDNNTPLVKFDGKILIGKAVPKAPVPEYEILSLKIPQDIIGFINGKADTPTKFPLENYLKGINSIEDGWCKIHSVKRLSDNEVFTVNEIERKWGKILKFRINNGTMEAYFEYLDVSCWIDISSLEKVKPKLPLFTTEDGIAKYEGENTWYWEVNSEHQPAVWYDLPNKLSDAEFDYSNYKFFSTKEAAMEYIYMNKPLFSALDIMSFGGKTDIRGDYAIVYVDEIKKLVKSKINP